jgi:lysophospholipase L1-like esterase
VDASARSAFVSVVSAYSPSILWIAIGTNDYGLNKWSAASFGTAYAALLDALNSALPDLFIYCQTPIVRANEAANGSGSKLGDYRTQIATAVSTRTAYAKLIDGTAILTTDDLADGVHPTTAGHATYAAAVIAELGL